MLTESFCAICEICAICVVFDAAMMRGLLFDAGMMRGLSDAENVRT